MVGLHPVAVGRGVKVSALNQPCRRTTPHATNPFIKNSWLICILQLTNFLSASTPSAFLTSGWLR